MTVLSRSQTHDIKGRDGSNFFFFGDKITYMLPTELHSAEKCTVASSS